MSSTGSSSPQRTAVFVHPHPDDEAIFSGGAMRRAANAGWRVVLVLATSGEEGEMPDWVMVDAADHRRMETAEAADHLGVSELHYLGYRDSGMAGSATNSAGRALATSVADAATDLAELLDRVQADAVIGQDPNGTYGHPDHVAVHQVVRSAAHEVGVGELLEVTLDRSWLRNLRHDRIERGWLSPDAWALASIEQLGTELFEAMVHLDVTPELAFKQAAMAAHASQVPDAQDFMGIPPGTFHLVVRNEWYLRSQPSQEPGLLEQALLGTNPR